MTRKRFFNTGDLDHCLLLQKLLILRLASVIIGRDNTILVTVAGGALMCEGIFEIPEQLDDKLGRC